MHGGDHSDLPTLTVGVLAENWIAVDVYRSCQWTMLVPPMGGALIHAGVSSQEIVAAMRVHGVRRCDWPSVDDRVRIMVSAAAAVYAERREAAEGKAKAEADAKARSRPGR